MMNSTLVFTPNQINVFTYVNVKNNICKELSLEERPFDDMY